MEKNACESLILFNFQAAAGGGNKMAKADDFDKIDIKKEAEAGRVSTFQNVGLCYLRMLLNYLQMHLCWLFFARK